MDFVEALAGKYQVRRLTEEDAQIIYELCRKNELYYQYCPPFVTLDVVRKELRILPPKKTLADKFYLGFFEGDELIAVMDLIDDYPKEKTAYIGFFMTDISVQKKGVGTEIINNCCEQFRKMNYERTALCWVKGNPQAEHFWKKNQFVPMKETSSNAADRVIYAERKL